LLVCAGATGDVVGDAATAVAPQTWALDDVHARLESTAKKESKGVPLEGRGLHSSTFRLNFSAFCGIGVHLGVV